jgi:hypothetical protein
MEAPWMTAVMLDPVLLLHVIDDHLQYTNFIILGMTDMAL